MTTLNAKEAYSAMFYFLEDIYLRTKSDELGGILGTLAMLDDGQPADPAVWEEWEQAIEKGKEDSNGLKLHIRKKEK